MFPVSNKLAEANFYRAPFCDIVTCKEAICTISLEQISRPAGEKNDA